LQRHCSDARGVWNEAVAERKAWLESDRSIPTLTKGERYKKLTIMRAETKWLREGSVIVQQQALRDYEQALAMGFKNTHGFPTWRKIGKNEGFRITNFATSDIRILNKTFAEVRIPKIGYIKLDILEKQILRLFALIG